jgi:hypothetical protein
MHPFQARPIQPRGVVPVGEWYLKRYTIVLNPRDGAGDAEWPDFAAGRALVHGALPQPAVTNSRPGVGFMVEHRGQGADYIVLGWWDRVNELPVRVAVREHQPGSAWRPAVGAESFCVWDLQVIAFERDAYVATMMAGGAADGSSAAGGGGADARGRDAYLSRQLHVQP